MLNVWWQENTLHLILGSPIGSVISSNLFYPISFAQNYLDTWSPSGFNLKDEKFFFFTIETTYGGFSIFFKTKCT
jgi:hypothetical protein